MHVNENKNKFLTCMARSMDGFVLDINIPRATCNLQDIYILAINIQYTYAGQQCLIRCDVEYIGGIQIGSEYTKTPNEFSCFLSLSHLKFRIP